MRPSGSIFESRLVKSLVKQLVRPVVQQNHEIKGHVTKQKATYLQLLGSYTKIFDREQGLQFIALGCKGFAAS